MRHRMTERVKEWESECGEYMAYVCMDTDAGSPKYWYTGAWTNGIQERTVTFVSAQNNWAYDGVVFDEIYPAVGNSWEDLRDHAIEELGFNANVLMPPPICKPLWVHDHGGITKFHTGGSTCRFDSFQVGWAIARPGVSEQWIEVRVKEMEMYLTNEIYGVVLHKKNNSGDTPKWDAIDSCFGIYDDTVNMEHCFQTAVDMGFPFSTIMEKTIPKGDA